MAISPPDVQRPRRADARRNHERILKAARRVFADKGRDAQIDDVARRAKVGVGTVYRHFPTKEALLEGLAREQFARITEWAREAVDAPDPWKGLCDLLWRGAELQARDRALMEAVSDHKSRVAGEARELHACVEVLMRRAQVAGQMRADATHDDVRLLMCGLGTVMLLDGEGWRRYLTVMLDGLRA